MNKIPIKHANIINILGIEKLPLDQKKEIVESAAETVEANVIKRIAEQLGGEKLGVFNEALANEDEEETIGFLNENNIDILALVEEETERLKEDLARRVAYIEKTA